MGNPNKHLSAPFPPFYHLIDVYHRKHKFPKRGGMHVLGGENLQNLEGPGIVAYVHRDKSDPEYIGSAALEVAGLQMRWLAKKDVYDEIFGVKAEDQSMPDHIKVAILRLFLEMSGNYTIERGKNIEEKVAKYIAKVFRKNGVISWAPEGHRCVEDGRNVIEDHIKGGAIMAAMEYGVPIIPAAVAGLLPDDPPGVRVVSFGEQIPIEKVTAEDELAKMREMRRLRKGVHTPVLAIALQEILDQAYDAREELLTA